MHRGDLGTRWDKLGGAGINWGEGSGLGCGMRKDQDKLGHSVGVGMQDGDALG